MDSPEALDVSKENIQPLRQGRIASQLSAALQAQTDATILQNLVKKRQEYELLLRTYEGDDPLSIWFEYVEWVEQTFPKDGKEGNLMTLLQNCLTRFKDSMEYFQDIRLVKLWIKYLEKLENPLELYSQLHCHGIGSQCALFYKCWAYELYENNDFKQANKVLLTGIGRNAQPIDELMRAHENFQIAVARRVMDKSLPVSEENNAGEERKVGNVLTTFGKKHKVPSVRIGGRVKSNFPGTLQSKENLMPQRNVDPVNIYEAENDPEIARSVNKMQTVPHFEILKKENTKKPTPWSGVKQKSAYQFHPPKPSFHVLTDENSQPEPLNTVMFLNALKPRKKDDGFNCPIAIFEVPNPNHQPMYPKDQVYAGGTEYSLEELKAVKYMKHKEKRNKELLVPDSQDAIQKERALCTISHSAETEKLYPLTDCLSDISISTSKKENNLCSYTENVFHEKQQLNASSNTYEKCIPTDISSTTGSDCLLGDKLSEHSSVPNSQNQHLVEGAKFKDSAQNQVAEMENLYSSVSCRVFTPVPQSVVKGSCISENVQHADMHYSENTDTLSSSTKHNSCTQGLLAKNNQQQLSGQGTLLMKGSSYGVLTTRDGVDFSETDKAGVSLTSLNKDDMLCSVKGDTMTSPKQSSCTSASLLAENEQRKLNNPGALPVKENNFSLLTVEGPTCSPETDKAADLFTFNKEETTHSETADIVLSNKSSSCMRTLLRAEKDQQKQIDDRKPSLKSSGFSIYTPENVVGSPATAKVGDFFNSLNKEEIPDSETADNMLSNKPSSCMRTLLRAENDQQKQINDGKSSLKNSGFSIFTTEDDVGSPATAKVADFFNSFNKKEIPYSETADNMLSNKPSSCMRTLLRAENDQQKLINDGKSSLKSSGFSIFTTEDVVDSPATTKAGDFFNSLNKEEIPYSETADNVLSNKPSSCMRTLLRPENDQQKQINDGKSSLKSSGFSIFTTEDVVGSPATTKAGDFFNSLNKEEVPYSETADNVLSNKPSSCMRTLLRPENDQQKQINDGKSSLKSSGFSIFTAEDVVGSPETVKAGDFFNALNKEDIPYSENEGIMLSTKPSPCKSSFLVARNKQQKQHNQDTFSVKGTDFSVFTTGEDDGARETVKTGDMFIYSRTEEILTPSDHTNNVLANKVEGLSSRVLMQGNENKQYEEIHEGNVSVHGNRVPEFPIFSDEENCYAKDKGGLVKAGQENGFSGFPSRNKNIFSHSVLCGPDKPFHNDARSISSTTKKNKVAPFPLFVDDGEVPGGHEPCVTKRELFRDAALEPSDKLCCVDSKENVALTSMCTPVNRPITEKREIKVCDNVVTASMIKLRQKKVSEQIKEPAAEECEQVTLATAVPRKSEGCVPSSISASSEEVLKVINECWASPPKIKSDAGNLLCPEPHKEPEDTDFQHRLPLKLSALFPDNKENALAQCVKQNVSEPANTSVNDDWFIGQLGEPRALDDTCCTLMFSKTLISSTPNRKSGGPLNSDSSDSSPPDSQEFKIPRRCTPLQAERFPIMPRPDALSVIMESSKENKSQSSSGSSSGGRTTHHTAFSLVSPQTGNTHSALEMQPPSEAHAIIMTRSLPPLDEDDSSI